MATNPPSKPSINLILNPVELGEVNCGNVSLSEIPSAGPTQKISSRIISLGEVSCGIISLGEIPNTSKCNNTERPHLEMLDSIHDITRRQIAAGSSVLEVWEKCAFDLDMQHILACHAGTKRHSTGLVHIAEDHVLGTAQAHAPLLACSLILSISFPLGFFLGVCPMTGVWEYVQPFAIGLFLCGLAGWTVAWERFLLLWAFKLWIAWAFIFWAPMQVLVLWFGREHRDSSDFTSIRSIFMLLSAGATLPWPFAVMKLCNYNLWSLRKAVFKVCVCNAFQTAGVVLGLLLVFFDSCWLAHQKHLVAQVARPFICYLIGRVSEMLLLLGMNFHPSPLFRITYLFFGKMFLASVDIIGAAQSDSWLEFFHYLLSESVGRLMGFYDLAISETKLAEKSYILRFFQRAANVGGAAPYHGMDALQYSCLENCITTLCTISCILGALMLYALVLQFLDSDSTISYAVDFWFPKGDTTALQLCLLLVREIVYEWLIHKLATFKTGIQYRGVFVRWLDEDSCVGWSTLFGIALAATLGPGFFSVFSHVYEPFSEFAEQYNLPDA